MTALNVTPAGKAPDSLSVGEGIPLAVTAKLLFGSPRTKVVVAALVIAGARVMVVLGSLRVLRLSHVVAKI